MKLEYEAEESKANTCRDFVHKNTDQRTYHYPNTNTSPRAYSGDEYDAERKVVSHQLEPILLRMQYIEEPSSPPLIGNDLVKARTA